MDSHDDDDYYLFSDLFCRDPDTGDLHAVNTTWQSLSFCGNYTCKMIRKSATDNNSNTTTIFTPTDPTERTINESHANEIPTVTDRNINILENDKIFKADNLRSEKDLLDNSELDVIKDENDRYLNEAEIKTISTLLRSVKKSDLDSIVEVYNLAQDIYKDMDEAGSESILTAAPSDIRIDTPRAVSDQYQYPTFWYDPATYYRNAALNTASPDAQKGTLNQVLQTQYQADSAQYNTNLKDTKAQYYYPISPFQRLSSYVYDPYSQQRVQSLQSNENQSPCNHDIASRNTINALTPWNNKPYKKAADSENRYQTGLLPYPFSYIHHYNYTSNPNDIYFDTRYWSNLNGQYQPVNTNYENSQLNPATQILTNNNNHQAPYPYGNKEDYLESNVKKSKLLHTLLPKTQAKVNGMPAWKTESLSDQVLEEVRANILERSDKLLKSNPFKSKLKLEKVGKVLRLGELSRSKRDIDEVNEKSVIRLEQTDDDYEAYLDKTV